MSFFRSIRRGAPVLVAVSAVAGTLGPGTQAAAAGNPSAAGSAKRAAWRTTNVYVQGDSLTVGTAAPLRRSLGRKIGQLGVDAAVGRHTETGLARLRQDPRARRADIWVVALGTNDAPDPAVVAGQVRRSLRLAGPRRAVVWLTLRRPGAYGRVNRMLRDLGRRKPQLHVVDWARTTRTRNGVLAGDGVHATAWGYRVRASIIAQETLRIATDTAALRPG